jgi:hypothetical protein
MGLGPFVTYVPPGVYTRTLTEANVSSLVAGIRIPVFIGVGQEELEQLDLEMVRGSSSTLDQQIVREDVSMSFVVDDTNPNNPILGPTDGTKTKVRIRNFPIVDGQGFGKVTNDARSVTITVNGEPVAVGAVQGAPGYVILQVPPQIGDDVRVTYFFHRGDTSFTDDVSAQVTTDAAALTSPGYEPFSIVTGNSDTFILKVDGYERTMTFAPANYTAVSLKSVIDALQIVGLTVSVFTDNMGLEHLQFNSAVSLEVGSGNANGPLGFSTGAKTSRNNSFKVFQVPVVDGTGGGITTTDPSKVVVKVSGLQVIPTAIDGRNGVVTLPYAPQAGSTVTVQYWTNTWQDTFDYLPNTLVTNVIRSGISPARADYIESVDFVISNPTPDTSIVHWGTSYVVASTRRTSGADPFDSSQIVPTLVDDKLYLAECARVTNTAVVPAVLSSNEFVLPEVPTLGNGRDTPIGTSLYSSVANSRQGTITSRPDLVVVRVGRSLNDALNRPAAVVTAVDPVTRIVKLKDPVPSDYKAYSTFWYNRITDSTYILTCKVPGPVGAGQYEVYDTLSNSNLYHVRFGAKGSGLSGIVVQWPRGSEKIPDAFHHGGTPVSETATVLFSQAAADNAAYTIKGAAPYSFYAPTSATWGSIVNGTTVSVNLAAAGQGWLVGRRTAVIQSGIDAGKITIGASSNTLALTIDGVNVDVTITAGNRTPVQIVADINAAIDLVAPFDATEPNTLAGFTKIGPTAGDVIFWVKSYTVPATLPNGFDHVSRVSIRQGTAEVSLGFSTFQSASGSPTAINKPATLLGSKTGAFNITAGLNDTFRVRVDGFDYEASLPTGAAVAASAVVTAINAVPGLTSVASVNSTGPNANKIRITSQINSDTSAVTILNGNANSVLGFTLGDFGSQVRVGAQEVVNLLNATVNFASRAIAYVSKIGSSEYVTIESNTVGATASSVGFASTSNSAFNRTTGTNVLPGTDGDSGEDAHDQFAVSSNNPLGSSGVGRPGQTYTDARTGLRFTVLPATGGSYGTGSNNYFTFEVSPTFVVNPAAPTYAIPGLETTVSNTVNVSLDDTATVQTFNPSGVEPANGDFYYISYRYMKQDFSTRIFQQFKTIEANFGRVSAENRVSLAAYLAILNGAVLVGIKQVLKVPNTNQANDQAFVTAIKELEIPLPGNIKPDVMVPLSTSTAVYAYLTQHCEVMSNIRNQSERMGVLGFASGTRPTSAQAIAKGLNSNRIIAVYPDSAVITLTNELGESFETLVDGSFLAAAVAGAAVSPAVDVATPYTRRRIQGFTRLPRIMDPVEANQTAVAGITVLEDLDPIIRIRQGLTTNMSSVLTRLPTVTQIADHVQQQCRATLDSFVGTKFLGSRVNDVQVAMTNMFKAMIQAEIVAAFTGVAAAVDTDDPTVLRAEAYYMPIFPLLYICVTFNLRARL